MSQSSWQDRLGWFILVFFLAITPIVMVGTKGAWDGIKNRVEDWLPETFEETQRLMWFYDRFGTDELLMVSWEGCTLEDPRVARYAQAIGAAEEVNGEEVVWFGEVITGPEALESLTAEPLDLPKDLAINRLKDWLIGEDESQTCVVAVVSPQGENNRAAAIEYAYDVANRVEGLSREDLIIAGTTLDGVAIDKASKGSLAALNLGSFAVCIIIMAISFRSARATIMVFVLAIFCEQLSMAIMYFSGQQMDSVLTLASNLTYVLSISSGVHLMNYYRESLAERSAKESVRWALRSALVPCLLSAGTTAVGMLSLTVSQIRPVTNFGFYAAASILAAAVVLLLWLPAAMFKFPIDPATWHHKSKSASRLQPLWSFLSKEMNTAKWPIFGLSLVVLCISVIGVQKISTSAQLHDLFWSDAPILRDYDWLEERVGPLIPIEVVLRIEQPEEIEADERFRIIDHVQQSIQEVEGVSATMSAATFAPVIPAKDERGFRAVMRRASIRKILEGRLDRYVEMNYLRIEEGDELWRISARVRAADRLNYGELMQRLRASVDQSLKEYPGVQPIYSGSVPLIFKAQSEMLSDLIKSFGLAFVMIAIIMMVLLRNIVTGLFSMIPNVLPTLLAFGTMGYLGMQVEIGSLLTASAALGIAVDDSLHFISWFNKGLQAGKSKVEATRLAYDHCGLAMIQTSLICSLGLLVFALSPFTPVSRFAWLMCGLLLTALLCDLLILPAILLCFTKKPKPTTETSEAGLGDVRATD
ncbi:efflux RND transporter permease subunit [Bremerella sp.]|uniref:efflux RND transporter permease subunit n=1 Tax=Bremerella sp. TaxID=2795602 RepID=UPI003919F075